MKLLDNAAEKFYHVSCNSWPLLS